VTTTFLPSPCFLIHKRSWKFSDFSCKGTNPLIIYQAAISKYHQGFKILISRRNNSVHSGANIWTQMGIWTGTWDGHNYKEENMSSHSNEIIIIFNLQLEYSVLEISRKAPQFHILCMCVF
jgi:hypothetical protein